MTTQPRYMHECNPVEQQERQNLLDELYVASGRDRKNDPNHGTYTGLWREWTAQQEAA